MEKVGVKVTFNMGWCLSCHRQKPGYINAPIWSEEGELIRYVSRANNGTAHDGTCQEDNDCRRMQTCNEGTCEYSDYAKSAHLDIAGPQSCTTCHR